MHMILGLCSNNVYLTLCCAKQEQGRNSSETEPLFSTRIPLEYVAVCANLRTFFMNHFETMLISFSWSADERAT